MSLFDVIRYPLSLPPTAEELSALPKELYTQWINNSSWKNIDTKSSMDLQWVSSWMCEFITYRNAPYHEDIIIRDIHILRDIIKKWDKE